MQALATEMNLSETAFVCPDRQGAWGLRWFTPKAEVDLCGHATLAAAHALWEAGLANATEPIQFRTKASGILTCGRYGELITMNFPALDSLPAEAPAGLLEALGLPHAMVHRSKFDFLVVVDSESTLRSLGPDFRALAQINMRGVIVTTAADETGIDFVSRFFAPSVGVDEDPVTGSAHCCLAVYWAKRLGKTSLIARQLSQRGGEVRMDLLGERVTLMGQAVTVYRGELARASSPG